MNQTEFNPYADDETVVTVGDLAIENGTDAILVHGSLVIDGTPASDERVRRLLDVLNRAMAAKPTSHGVRNGPILIDNPFL